MIDDVAFKAGSGNWLAFRQAGLGVKHIFDAAERWATKLSGISRPWLCWNVDDDWCWIQQRLVESVGWTPIVGFDPRVGPPHKMTSNALSIDFNAEFGLPVMYPHFPMEFAFLFCDRLAFWHSDLLIRLPLMERLARQFEELPDGWTAATQSPLGFRDRWSRSKQRYWELVGCTTREASRDQFNNGCGWWMNFAEHPNCRSEEDRVEKKKYYWDHGTGIYFWHKKYGGKVGLVRDRGIHEGHFTKIGNKKYVRQHIKDINDVSRSMHEEINTNVDLCSAINQMRLNSLL